MAKFTVSQGKFIWDSGNPETEVEDRDEIDDNFVEVLRDKTDYFSNSCTNVYSNLESCFNQKVALYESFLTTDFSDYYDSECATKQTSDYSDFYGTVEDVFYSSVEQARYDSNQDSAYDWNRINVKINQKNTVRSGWLGGWCATVKDTKAINYEVSDFSSNWGDYWDDTDTSNTQYNDCNVNNTNHNDAVEDTNEDNNLGTEHSGYYSNFDDQ